MPFLPFIWKFFSFGRIGGTIGKAVVQYRFLGVVQPET